MKQNKVIASLVFTSLVFCQPLPFNFAYAKTFNSLQENNVSSTSTPSQNVTILEVNKPLEVGLTAEQSHSYSIPHGASYFLNLSVEQKGIDIVIRLLSPSGKLLEEVDTPTGTRGIESLTAILEEEGNYLLEIKSLEKDVLAGKYQILVKELHASTDKDIELIKTNKLKTEAEALIKSKKYDQALPIATNVLETKNKLFGENHIDTVSAINTLADVYYYQKEYDKAEHLYFQALEIRKKALGEDHADSIISLNNIGALFYIKKDFNKAEPYLIKVLELTKKTFGENDPFTATSLNNLARLYSNKKEYDKAEAFYIQTLEAKKKLWGENHFEVAQALHMLAGFYDFRGDYSKGIPLLLQALEIDKKVFGENALNTTSSMNNLALLYKNKGDYAKAEALYLKSLEISQKILGENHQKLATSLNNLAGLYKLKGDYTKAEPLYIQALEINKKAFGEDNVATAISMNNLAGIYHAKGDYVKAEPLYIKALETARKILGETNITTVTTLSNLAGLYNSNKDYSKAEPLLIQAVELCKKALGENHPQTATAINNLAGMYYIQGDYTKSESLNIKALEIRKKVFGEGHPETAQSIDNLARLYLKKQEYAKAEPLLLQALVLRRKAFGEHHPDTAGSLNNLAIFYEITKDYAKAVRYKKESNNAKEVVLSRNLTIGSEIEKQRYLQLYANDIDTTLSLQTQKAPNDSEATELALTEVLRRKGRSIDAVNQNLEALRKRSKPEDLALLDSLTDKKILLSNLVTQGNKSNNEEYQQKLKTLQEEIENLEYKVSEKSIEFSSQNQPVRFKSIQKLVPKDATLVEFASYKIFDPSSGDFGKSHYAAYLLNNKGNPLWVDLGETETIDKLVDELRNKLRDKKANVAKDVKPLARELDKLVMQPVRNLIEEKENRLLIAPDGKLNLIPFEALVDENGKFLIENHSLSYLTSGRDLLRLKVKVDSKDAPVIIGNPNFGETSDITTQASVFSSFVFSPLKATELEAKAIKRLLPNAQLLLKQEATEEALIAVNAPSILHIATHGFFLKDQPPSTPEDQGSSQDTTRIAKRKNISDEVFDPSAKIENPLLRSGIALAGANLNQTEVNNGIFTALKATSLNLWGTKIVVLSACDTGVGEVKSGDGVYGLRRALVLAGSETQMMSLWAVSDVVTKDLMISYYSKLKKGMGRGDALRQTQLELLKSPNYNHPFYWASFVQSGQWDNINDPKH